MFHLMINFALPLLGEKILPCKIQFRCAQYFIGEMSPGNCPQSFEQEEGGFGGGGWMMGWGWRRFVALRHLSGRSSSLNYSPNTTSSTDYCHAFYKPPPTQMIKRPWS